MIYIYTHAILIYLSLCSGPVSCEEGTFTVTAVVRVPEDKFATWATFQWLGSWTRHFLEKWNWGFIRWLNGNWYRRFNCDVVWFSGTWLREMETEGTSRRFHHWNSSQDESVVGDSLPVFVCGCGPLLEGIWNMIYYQRGLWFSMLQSSGPLPLSRLLPRFRILLESARKTAQWFLNRPGIAELRSVDEKYYMVGLGGKGDDFSRLFHFIKVWTYMVGNR